MAGSPSGVGMGNGNYPSHGESAGPTYVTVRPAYFQRVHF